jgi:tetratricopeptide (TPR) repeat protein
MSPVRAVKFICVTVLSIVAGFGSSAQDPSSSIDAAVGIRESLRSVEEMRKAADYQKGLGLAKEALHQAEELGNDELITEALYQISLIHYFMESFEEARAYMEIGLTHARLHGITSLEADLLNAQGVLEWKQGNLYEASAKLTSALKIREQQQQWVSMASIANNLGIIAYSLQKYAEAVEHYKQGLEWLEKEENQHMRSSLFSNLGESLIPLGRYEEAESYLLQSLEIELGKNEPHGLAYTYFNLGELRSGQGDSEKAVELYHKALEIQLDIGNDWSAALTRLKLAREHMKSGDAEKALEELMPGYEAAKQMNALTLLRDYATELASIYKASGDTGMARYYSELQDWFATRSQAKDPKRETVRVQSTLPALPQASEPQSSSEMSTIRMATLGLLIILIFILVIENMRLRKLMQKD